MNQFNTRIETANRKLVTELVGPDISEENIQTKE